MGDEDAAVKLGFIHPGTMGVSVAVSAIASGNEALWAGEGRSAATISRAQEHGLRDVGTIESLCREADILFSICPPSAAEAVANDVAEAGFSGVFVDANAISPVRMLRIADVVGRSASVVDGGIIGHPAWQPGTTLHLSGAGASDVAACFADGLLEANILEGRVGDASALKMCYAALTKGTTALLCAILAASERLGVRDHLNAQWARDGDGLDQEREMRVRQVTAKAWRYVGEMEEIASTFEAAGQPGGFHLAAADIYQRLARLKDGPHPSDASEVLACLAELPAESAKRS